MDSWFYMNTEEKTAADLKEAAAGFEGIEQERWREANILEITLEGGSTVDFEPMQPYFRSKEDDEYLKSHHIRTLFAVTAGGADEKRLHALFQRIARGTGGYFCADTEDFTPVIDGEER